MEQQFINKETVQAARQALEFIRNTNLENATFAEKQDIVAELCLKVYPSDEGKVVRIVARLNPGSEFRISPYKTSMASPKL